MAKFWDQLVVGEDVNESLLLIQVHRAKQPLYFALCVCLLINLF